MICANERQRCETCPTRHPSLPAPPGVHVGPALAYYRDATLLGAVPLDGCAVADRGERGEAPAGRGDPRKYYFDVDGKGDPVPREFYATSLIEQRAWIDAIRKAVDAHVDRLARLAPAARARRRSSITTFRETLVAEAEGSDDDGSDDGGGDDDSSDDGSAAPEAPAAAAPPPSPSRGKEVRGLALLAPPGLRVLKHCRHARPHGCYLMLDVHGSHLMWTKKRRQAQQGSIKVDEITDVTIGLSTNVLARHGHLEKAHFYLSIITKFRTLDLEADSLEVRDDLAAAVDFLREHPDI